MKASKESQIENQSLGTTNCKVQYYSCEIIIIWLTIVFTFNALKKNWSNSQTCAQCTFTRHTWMSCQHVLWIKYIQKLKTNQ